MADWTKTIKNWTEGEKKNIKKVKKSFAFFLYSNIVKRTPVDTGRARSNWNVSIGSADLSTTESNNRRYNLQSIPESNGDECYFITNNLPYIGALEYGRYPDPVKKGSYDKKRKQWIKKSEHGFSKQAPNGMVGVTVAEAHRLFNLALNEVGE